jgi:hypothetical protein
MVIDFLAIGKCNVCGGNKNTVEMNQTQSEPQPQLKTECGFGIVLGKLLKNDLANKCYC